MLIYVMMLFGASLLYSMQFFFNQTYEKENGTGVAKSLLFTAYATAIAATGIFIILGFKVNITLFSLIMSLWYGVNNIACIYVSMKSLSEVNLSKYSIYMMLGGMLLPSIFGMAFRGENTNILKFICIALIICALFFTYEKGKNTKKAKYYFIAVFILNGMFGIIANLHQKGSYDIVGTFDFMFLSWILSAIICVSLYCIIEKKLPIIKPKTLICPAGFAVVNGVAEVVVFYAASKVDASIQYPIITGCTIVFSALISAICGEKMKSKNIVAIIVAFMASVVMGFAI